MSITLHVSLLSGRTFSAETELDVGVATFRERAQAALSVGKGRLVHSCGLALDGASTLRECGLQNGDVLNLQVLPVTIQASRALDGAAFAAILGDGSVVTWGRAD